MVSFVAFGLLAAIVATADLSVGAGLAVGLALVGTPILLIIGLVIAATLSRPGWIVGPTAVAVLGLAGLAVSFGAAG